MNRTTASRKRRMAWILSVVALLTAGMATLVSSAGAAVSHNPVGHIDRLVQVPGGISIRGWALDPDTTASIKVDIYADGRGLRRVLAGGVRRDLARTHPGHGINHGFSASLSLAAGRHNVCAYAINVGAGTSHTLLGCRIITLNFNPTGRINVKQVPGGLTMTGWTFDPDAPLTSLAVRIDLDGKVTNMVARLPRPDVAARYPAAGAAHGFKLAASAGQGVHSLCVTVANIGFGSNAALPCAHPDLNFLPTTAITGLTQTTTGAQVTGWATDPDTASPVTVTVTADGNPAGTVLANGAAGPRPGHAFVRTMALTPGLHHICVVGKNLSYGSGTPVSACRDITLNFDPFGHLDTVTRASGSTSLRVTGWAIDPNTTGSIQVAVTVDGTAVGNAAANRPRLDLRGAYPAYGAIHGYTPTFAANDKEHTVCVVAKNVGMGSDHSLGCRIINAVHPIAPSMPRGVAAVGGFGGATVTWSPPSSDGGAPWTRYTVTAYPGGIHVNANAAATTATVVGLKASASYYFTVVATNVAGTSNPGRSPSVKTQANPPPQRTPAPVSTSRYTRNIHSATTTDLNTMLAEGLADARANPSGHGYIILLDIGGQTSGGVVLSATAHFVSYANLVKCIKAYVDGYHRGQRPSAPVMIALGTNNDMSVSASSGSAWARYVVNPIRTYASRYTGMRIAGANDIEPGFRANYPQTKAWLTGYLAATPAPFVFNGSADGCAWAAVNRGCNNGWTMSGLYTLAGGMSPTRIINLPQIYNNTMAAQWKYISLTGVAYHRPRINFGGALTEWTACYQSRSCGSLTGRNAWTQMWSQLQSSLHLRVSSLPYATDLRIDR